MPISPIELQYWQIEGDFLDEAIAQIVLEALISGMSGGLAALPPEYQGLYDLDGLNAAALDYVKRYKSKIVDEINRKTQRDVRRIYEEWILSGKPLQDLENKLLTLNIFSKERAKRIAVTEITRIFADGNSLAWQQAGYVEMVKWQTARDERVCPICVPLAGKEIPLNELRPPAHVRCRCWLIPVINPELVQQKIRNALLVAP